MLKGKLLAYTLISMAILLVIQYYLLTGFSTDSISSIVLNLITEGISILITVLIIDKLIKREEEREKSRLEQVKREEQERLIKEIIGNRLAKLFAEISSVYINFVTKEPLKFQVNVETYDIHKNAIIEIVNNIDKYVVAGFRSKPVTTIILDFHKLKEEGLPKEQIIPYQEYCHDIFKSKIEYVVGKFIERYISVLPDDLRIALYKIENSIDHFVFFTTYQIGFKAPLPTGEKEIKELKENLLIIGEELLYIHKLID